MKINYKKLKQILLILLVSFSMTIFLNYSNYVRYNSSLFAIQTVDFNILSHTLPTKLSYTLIEGNLEELQRTLDSNYGLFGLVITDCKVIEDKCPNQKILFSTNSRYKNKNYTTENLSNNHYDFLKDPVPLVAEGFYESSYTGDRLKTGRRNEGKIIGRVYYIRVDRPDFLTSQILWLKKPFYPRGVNILYTITLMLFLTMGILLFCIIQWVTYKYRIQKHLDQQKYEEQLKNNEIKRLEAENKLLRITSFNNVFGQVIEQDFSSVIGNRLQELDSILKNILLKIDSDIQNIVHDIYKAPLLFNLGYTPRIINEFKNKTRNLEIYQPLVNFLLEANETIKTLDWVVKDLRGTTRIESEPTLIQKEIEYLSHNLPPSLNDWKINFDCDSYPLWINCNPWHFRSIIKNALYNSSAALKKYRRKLKIKDFQGYILVRCYTHDCTAIIDIEDNGPGIPLEMLPLLYESSERLNKTAGEIVGNGSMIVFAYLSLHGGKVEKMNLDKGAKVSFKFPLISNELR
ncbi:MULTISPECIES: HAMP domain-containing sensor histidine kinase [Nostoc]|uniref:HAMP domain-containing histidine kinase n=1 Tax=Nostoc paludosum FACHB-159 TaxID=2692908 RepID=A0ABR8KHF7_9NOSO|nr:MULTISPECIES: HAMP domain-containing sensor histidine kinase [Nostoc]MBD2682645.1 HAMP domain-containing histidine kinase [Nostoc sp. FACHB-857]MBD2738979.1 HAMP domain-containing histidine kinase [Nostoc paludosum FACHB-159]